MTILNPWAAYLFSIIPPVIVLYLIKKKRKDQFSTTWFLWEQTIREERAKFRLHRLMRILQLVLQILAIGFFILALMDLQVPLRKQGGKGGVIFVLDASASMNAAGGTVYRAAVTKAIGILDTLPDGTEITAVQIRRTPYLLMQGLKDKSEAADLLRDSRPTEEEGDTSAALSLASEFLKPRSGDRLVLLTDGAFTDPAHRSLLSEYAEVYIFSGTRRNAGITAFSLKPLHFHPDQYQAMVRVLNASDRIRNAELTIFHDDTVLVEDTLFLQAGEEKNFFYTFESTVTGRIRAALESDGDELSADDQAFTVLSQDPEIHVLYIGKGNIFIEKVFSVYPHAHLDAASALPPQDVLKQYQFVIIENQEVQDLPEGRYLLINSFVRSFSLHYSGDTETRLAGWRSEDSLLRGVDVPSLHIRNNMVLSPEGAGFIKKVLIAGSEGPVLFTFGRSGTDGIFLSWNLLDSAFPLTASFPVFFSNVISYFFYGEGGRVPRELKAGEPIRIRMEGKRTGSGEAFNVNAEARGGSALTAEKYPWGAEISRTQRTGFYRVAVDNGERKTVRDFAVNLTSRKESDLRLRTELKPRSDIDRPDTGTGGVVSLLFFFLTAGLVCLFLEGILWMYRRRG